MVADFVILNSLTIAHVLLQDGQKREAAQLAGKKNEHLLQNINVKKKMYVGLRKFVLRRFKTF